VTGTHVSRVAPDVVVWTISTTDLNKNLQEAKAASDAKLKAVLKLMGELKVAPEDIQTGYLNISKEYEQQQYGGRGAFRNFAVTRTVTVKQRDIQRFDEFLSKLVGNGDIEATYSLECSKFTEVRAEARLKALRIAKEKAAAMTKELEVKLGKVLKIDESKPQEQFWPNFAMNSANDVSRSGRQQVAEGEGGTFAPGLIEISVTVEVTFEME